MKDLLKQLQQLVPVADAASQGPWEFSVNLLRGREEIAFLNGTFIYRDSNDGPMPDSWDNAAFITAARSLLTSENLKLLVAALAAAVAPAADTTELPDMHSPNPSLAQPAPTRSPIASYSAVTPNSISLLVTEFAKALNEKMQAATIKYGYQADQWTDSTWRTDCIEELLEHIDKGDPLDVAAYCAFAWHHQWSLTPATTLAQMAEQRDEARAELEKLKAQNQLTSENLKLPVAEQPALAVVAESMRWFRSEITRLEAENTAMRKTQRDGDVDTCRYNNVRVLTLLRVLNRLGAVDCASAAMMEANLR